MSDDYSNYVVDALGNLDHGRYENAKVAAILAAAEAMRKQAEATEKLVENTDLLLDKLDEFAAALNKIADIADSGVLNVNVFEGR